MLRTTEEKDGEQNFTARFLSGGRLVMVLGGVTFFEQAGVDEEQQKAADRSSG